MGAKVLLPLCVSQVCCRETHSITGGIAPCSGFCTAHYLRTLLTTPEMGNYEYLFANAPFLRLLFFTKNNKNTKIAKIAVLNFFPSIMDIKKVF